VPTLETPMSPGGSQASAGEGLSPCNIGIGIGNVYVGEGGEASPLRYKLEVAWHAATLLGWLAIADAVLGLQKLHMMDGCWAMTGWHLCHCNYGKEP